MRTLNWQEVPEEGFQAYVRAFHMAAKKLAQALETGSGATVSFDACPALFMYRRAVEIQLKAIIQGSGGNFLAPRPDPLSIEKTRSVSWLGQFVCQIVTALKWEKRFRCEGVEGLAAFKAVMEEVNEIEPTYAMFRHPGGSESQRWVTIRAFTAKLDALLVMLDSTADALAATWAMRDDEDHFKPTVH